MASYSYILSFLLLFLSLEIAKCEFFTALIDLEHLVYRERELKSSLKNYIAMEEERLAILKKFSEKVENIHKRIDDNNLELFIGHPVNSYLIIKRFYTDWTRMEELIQKDNSEGNPSFLSSFLFIFVLPHSSKFSNCKSYHLVILTLI